MLFARLAIIGIVAGLFSFPGHSTLPAEASESLVSCRADAAAAGERYPRYTSSTARGDAVNNVRIVPVYAPKLYIDPRNNYDASYIGYRVTNNTGSALTDLRLTVDTFVGEVRLANELDATVRVGDIPNGESRTFYYLVKAQKDFSSSTHAVRLASGPNAIRQAACEAEILAVERSIAASPNRVTSIAVDTSSPSLGDTLTVTVTGSPGKVASASSDPFFSIMTMSPASQSSWPTRSLRLETVSVSVKGLGNARSIADACEASGGAMSGSGQTRQANFSDTLVITNFGACATTTKQTYVSTYTFRVIAPSQTDPVITPLADITSGQKVKYTGSLPATETTVPLTNTSVPLGVQKSANPVPIASTDTTVDVKYTVTASATGGTVQIDTIVDKPDPSLTLQSALQSGSVKVTDVNLSNQTISAVVDQAEGEIRFEGPFTASSSTPVSITYVLRLPRDSTVTNSAYGVSGSWVIGSGATSVDVIAVSTSLDGDGNVGVIKTSGVAPKTPQTMTFDPPQSLGEGDQTILTAFTDSGLPVTYQVSDETICTIVEVDGVFTLFALSQGTCSITATQAGSSSYAATSETVTIGVIGSQRITIESQTEFSSGSATVKLSASSGLVPTLQSLDIGVCTIGAPTTGTVAEPPAGAREFTITEVGAGQCVLIANQAGGTVAGVGDEEDVDFAAAPEVEVLIGVGQAQTISFVTPAANSSQIGGIDNTFNIVANASDGSTALQHLVDFQSLTPSVCEVVVEVVDGELVDGYSGNSPFNTTRKIKTLSAGTCTIQASQDGVNYAGVQTAYRPATATRSFTITAGSTAQVISFITSPATKTYGDASFVVLAVSKKADNQPTGLLVSLTAQGPCTIGTTTLTLEDESRATVTLTGAGNCVITGTQAGDFTYAAGTPQNLTITVTEKTLQVIGLGVTPRVYDATTDAAITGTPALSGVVPGDNEDAVALTGTAIGEFSSPDVGTGIAVSVVAGSLSLTGSKASSYVLASPSLSGTISHRPLTVEPDAITLPSGSPTPTSCDAVVVAGSLVGGDTVSVVCDFSNYDPSAQSGSVSFSITSITINLVTESTWVSDVVTVGNYEVTRQLGTLTVSDDEVPEIFGEDGAALDDITIVYGQTVSIDSPQVKKRNGDPASGTVSQKLVLNGSSPALDPTAQYDSGSYTVRVDFTSSGNGVANRTVFRQLVVQKRPVTYTFTPQSKVYDGTTDLPLPSFTIGPIAGNANSGPIGSEEVSVVGPNTGTLDDPQAGTRTLTWAGSALSGQDKENYSLVSPGPKSVTVQPRPITFTVGDHARFVDDNDPSEWTLDETEPGPGVGRVSGQSRASVLGAGNSVSKGTTTTVNGGVDYIPLTLNTPNGNPNYDITTVPGRLFLASVTFTVQATPGTDVLTDREVVCTCEGFEPGTALLEIRSTPQTLATITVDAEGDCAATTVTIPDSVDDGSHNLVLTGSFPTGEPAVKTRGVTLQTPQQQQDNNSQSPSPPSSTPPTRSTPSPRSLPPAPPLLPGTQNFLLPAGPNGSNPGPRTLPVDPTTPSTPPGPPAANSQNNGGLSPTPPSRVESPLTSVAERSQTPGNTFDLGVDGVDPAQVANGQGAVTAGTRSIGQMREETLGGFEPGTGLRVEVIGSRTSARFVISTLTGLDELVLIEQISRSSEGNRVGFAGIDRIGLGSPTGPQTPWSVDERRVASDVFAYSRFDSPAKQSDLLGSATYTWLNIEKGVSGYLPGSTVYLTATSSPVVFGEAEVDENGEAIVTGDLAVELLGLGEHRIRVVGTRVFADIQVDSKGEVIIPDNVLAEINQFDLGTDATVIVTGNNPLGGVHTVMRVVPLDPVSPWWTLWVIAWTALLLLLARLWGMIRTVMEKTAASSAVVISSIPALYLGWTSTVTEVAWWGLLMGLGFALGMWFVPRLRKDAAKRS